MNLNNQLQFFRRRGFLEVFGFSFDFFRANFKDLSRLSLLVLGPVFLVQLGIGVFLGNSIIGFSQSDALNSGIANQSQEIQAFSLYLWLYIMMFGFVFFLLNTFVTGYISLYLKEGKQAITLGKMFKYTYKNIWMVLLLNLLMGIALFFSAFLVIPFYWLMVSLSLASFVMLHENLSPIDAISRSNKLVSNNWWFTFGIMLFSGLCIMMLTSVFTSLAQLGIMVVVEFLPKVNESVKLLSLLLVQVIYLLTVLCLSFYSIVLAVQYGNLRERKEEKGKYLLIQSLGMNNPEAEQEAIKTNELV